MEHLIIASCEPDNTAQLVDCIDPTSRRRCEIWGRPGAFSQAQQVLTPVLGGGHVEEIQLHGLGDCIRVQRAPQIALQEQESLSDALFRREFDRQDADRMQDHLTQGHLVFVLPAETSDPTGTSLALERADTVDVARPQGAMLEADDSFRDRDQRDRGELGASRALLGTQR